MQVLGFKKRSVRSVRLAGSGRQWPRVMTAVAAFMVVMGFMPGHASDASAGTIIGLNGVNASFYPNPFDPDGDGVTTGSEPSLINFGFNGFGFGLVEGLPVKNLVSRRDSQVSFGAARVQGNAFSAFMQAIAPQSFDVGTVITAQYTQNYGTSSDYTLNLNQQSGGPMLTQSGPGTPGTHPYQVTTLSSVVNNAIGFRVDQTMVTFANQGGTRYADFNEVMLLPDRLTPIPVVGAAGSAPATGSTFGTLAGLTDRSGGLGDQATLTGGWRVDNPASDRFMEIEFSQSEPLTGLVLSNWRDMTIIGLIKDDNGVAIASFTMTGGGNDGGEILPIHFDQPVVTQSLRIEFSGIGPIGFREVIPLRLAANVVIPEPAAAIFLATGLFLIVGRQRRAS